MAKRFQKIHIEISNICNLQCSFCPPVEREKKLISTNLFSKALSEAGPLTEQICFHLMGEPLAHPNFLDFLNQCAETKAKLFLVTNGTLLKEKFYSALLNNCLEQINFSLHSFSDNFPGKDPTDYLEKIFSFTELALRERPDLYINFRIWNLQSLSSKDSASNDLLARIESRFGVQIKAQSDIRKKKNLKIVGRAYVHFDTEFQWPSKRLPLLGDTGTCKGLKTHLGILADGTVVPCCLDKEGMIPLGNIQNSTLNEILAGERAQAMRLGFQNNRLIEELCKHCSYISRFEKKTASVNRSALSST